MISVRNLMKRYNQDVIAVKEVSFDVRQGEIVALLGPSGCGKTTVLRCIAGFERPTSGEIYIDERLVSSGVQGLITPVENRGLGFVHQSYALWPHLSVYRNLSYALELRKFPQKEIHQRVQQTLELVHLGGYVDRLPSELSGGEQQRVALARSLVYNPSAILLDEPLSNLDAKLREQTRFELRRLFKGLNISALYVTHDQSEAMAIADRCIVMEKGTIQQIGKPIELYIKPGSTFVADFMGSSNIFSGVVCPDDSKNVDLPWGSFRHGCVVSSDRKKEVVICIRPKDISLHQDNPHMENTFRARITVKTFAGDFYKFLIAPVDQPQVEVLVHIYDYEKALRLEEGETIYVCFPPPCCQIVGTP
jgi:iron(III) transport system ATP-binding protein